MAQSNKDRAGALLKLHKILLLRPKDALPHPSDLAKKLHFHQGVVNKNDLVSLVEDDIKYRDFNKADQIFLFFPTSGYYAINLTEYGRSISPKISDFDIFNENLKDQEMSDETDESIRAYLSKIEPYKFENLVERILSSMGVQKLSTTQQSRDGGIDVRGTLTLDDVIHIKIAVQVKRYGNPIGPSDIQKLRGSLSNDEVGWFFTLSRFTPSAVAEAEALQRQPISLINGDILIGLIKKYNVYIGDDF